MLTITVLMENEAGKTLACEHGLSLLLACEGKTLLFDTGASDAFLRNASALGADLDAVSAIVLSHGHYDHTGGLAYALRRFAQAECPSMPEVIAHPDVLLPRRRAAAEAEPGKPLGISEPALLLLKNWPARFVKKPLQLTENLSYLGEIPRKYPEAQALLGEINRGSAYEPDNILDDSALVYITGKDKGRALTVIAGCAHSGIINIIEYAKTVTGVKRVNSVIGGFHIKDASQAVKEQTMRYFAEQGIETLRGCHCTGNALDGIAQQKPLHAGDYLEIA